MADDIEALDDDEAVLLDEPESEPELKAKLKLIQARCIASKIEFNQEDDVDLGVTAAVLLPAGKGTRRIPIWTISKADAILATEFENYRFIPGFEGLWNPSNNTVELLLQTTRMNVDSLLKKLLGIRIDKNISRTDILKLTPPGDGRPTIEIGLASSDVTKLLPNIMMKKFSIRLSNVRAKTSDGVAKELSSYANSLFFQIDLINGYSFTLSREKRARSVPLSLKRQQGIQVAYPEAHINDDSISLYWYGKSARGMPLLQYLAYYQCIEFYFPRYSQAEARRRVSNMLRRPTFRASNDDDLDALISTIQANRAGSFGSERSQLRAVVNECISAAEARAYFDGDAERMDHFSGKGSKSRFHKIPVAGRDVDLRNDIADRIYDIRCKIVHTKNEDQAGDLRMILPFSEDADYLLEDIELAEFVSRSVLSASASFLQ